MAAGSGVSAATQAELDIAAGGSRAWADRPPGARTPRPQRLLDYARRSALPARRAGGTTSG